MIPVIEFEGIMSIFLLFVVLFPRLYYYIRTFDTKFILSILYLATLTNLVWLAFAWYHLRKGMIPSLVVSIIVYLVVIVYLQGHK